MLFKSEKKEIKNMVMDVIEGCLNDLAAEAEEIKSRGLNEEELEAALRSAKRRHLSDCFGLTVSKVGEENQLAAEIMYEILLDHEVSGFNLEAEDGVLAGGIYATACYAITSKNASPAVCTEMNKMHALRISEIL